MAKKKKTGLGRGLDSLIPVFPEEDESEESSSLSLEDMLKEKDEEKEDKDIKESNEKKNNKKSESKKVATKSSKTTKKDEEKDIKEPKATSEEIATEESSTSEPIKDEIETKSQVESPQITEKTDQPISETPKISDTDDIKTPTKTSQEGSMKDKIVEVVNVVETEEIAKATETEPIIEEPEKTIEDIRDNLTEREKQSIDEVIKIIDKNPRITLWSAKSAAVFRYLRKTEPEFSISKEASKLIDEAVQAKYPEIWILFKDIEK